MKLVAVALGLLPTLFLGQTICIDPGQPSEIGLGTKGKRATENGINWEVAVALRNRLRKEGFAVVLTKGSLMEKVLNRDRAETANRHQATLMVRLHCDAAPHRGFAVYYPSQRGTSGGLTGPSARVIQRSKVAATAFHATMAERLKGVHPDNGLRTDLQTAVGAR
jgi:N-acetylmuramoyl-L-alanine amidase